METSIQNLMQEFKAFVFEEDELEFRDTSELKALLPLLAYQKSNSDVGRYHILIYLETNSPLQA